MKGDRYSLLLIVFFFVGCMTGSTLSADKVPEWVVSLSGAVAIIFATFLGAFFAFRFQREREEKTSREKDRFALNATIMEIIYTANKLTAIRNQFINPNRDSPARHLEILPVISRIEPPRLDLGQLGFIIETNERNLLIELSMLEIEVSSTLEVIQRRSDLHYQKSQPATERAARKFGTELSINQTHAELGIRDSATLKTLTDAMIDGIDNSIASCEKSLEALTKTGQKLFPLKTVAIFQKKNFQTDEVARAP